MTISMLSTILFQCQLQFAKVPFWQLLDIYSSMIQKVLFLSEKQNIVKQVLFMIYVSLCEDTINQTL